LPLLEYTLAELYERRERRVLRWSQYGGGLKGALICAADEVVSGADGDVETAFRDVMRELVSVGEDGAATRRYASLARFPPGTDARALLDGLIARRFYDSVTSWHATRPCGITTSASMIGWPLHPRSWLRFGRSRRRG
jgi:hypothetical protein